MEKQTACDWLRGFLQDGKLHDVNEVRIAAKAAGYSRAELRAAKWICGITATNNWKYEHPFTDRWFWALPEVKQ